MKTLLEWKTPQNCDGVLIQYAEPTEDIRYYIIRPQGNKAGDKWCGTVCIGVRGMECKSAKALSDDISKEKAIQACEDDWSKRKADAKADAKPDGQEENEDVDAPAHD